MSDTITKMKHDYCVVVLEVGHRYSIILHPDEYKQILELEEFHDELEFREETGRNWKVLRFYSDLLFTNQNKQVLVSYDELRQLVQPQEKI